MRGAELLSKRVVMRGIELGCVVDVILEESADRPIGLDVLCGDGEHRFLPMATVQIEDGQVEVESPLMLLEREQLDFYRARGRALRSAG
jgi:PRC-barrel domain